MVEEIMEYLVITTGIIEIIIMIYLGRLAFLDNSCCFKDNKTKQKIKTVYTYKRLYSDIAKIKSQNEIISSQEKQIEDISEKYNRLNSEIQTITDRLNRYNDAKVREYIKGELK